MIKGNKIKEIAEDIPVKGNTIAEERQQTQQTRLELVQNRERIAEGENELSKKNKQCSLITVVKAIGMFLPLVTTLGLLLWVLIKF